MWRRVFILFFSLFYAVAILALGGATWTRLYGPSPYHRLQASALLNGHLYIADSVYDLDQNLVLHGNRIHHVWGLGVGLWLAPFELIYRACGQSVFPDRLGLGVAIALFAAYSCAAGFGFAEKYSNRTAATGLVLSIMFCPALLSLSNGRQLVYEETSFYACIVSLGILTALIRFICFDRIGDYFVCAVLSGFAGLVRPTHIIYGLAGMIACSTILCLRKSHRRFLLPGNGIFLAGLLFLAATNRVRFGSMFEFGHQLTATSGAMVYFTRFQNPFRSTSFWDAGKELAGALFVNKSGFQMDSAEEPVPGQMFSASLVPNAVTWQSKGVRWRDMYMSTFDWSYAGILIVGFAGNLLWLLKRLRRIPSIWEDSELVLVGLSGWFAICFLSLIAFYWYFPVLSARYLLDLAPAFVAATLLVWLRVSRLFPKVSLILLPVWLSCEICSARNGAPRHYLLTRQEALHQLVHEQWQKLTAYNGEYSVESVPAATEIAFNGEGWNENDGMAEPVVVLVVDQPRFVNLKVGRRLARGQLGDGDTYRARIGNFELPLKQVTQEGEVMDVWFEVPEAIQKSQENELLFLCFINKCDEEDQISQRALQTVRWRE